MFKGVNIFENIIPTEEKRTTNKPHSDYVSPLEQAGISKDDPGVDVFKIFGMKRKEN